MRAHTWVFECALDAAFPVPQWLRIQVFDDGTMTGSVEPSPHESPTAAADERLLLGKPAGFQFYVLDGSATWRDVDGDGDTRCRCRFRLMRFSTRLREGQLIDCEAELLPPSHSDSTFGSSLRMESANVRRCIRSYSQDLVLPSTCGLRLVRQEVKLSIAPLVWRMTPGRYTFRGFTCAVSEMLYECTLTLQLEEDGTLVGFSEDLIHTFTRKSQLHGFWSADCVTFQMVDMSGYAPHVFVYSLAPHPSGLRGLWNEQVSKKRGYFQEGHAELVATSVQRKGTWEPSRHHAYPVEFQTAAQECLNLGRTSPRDGDSAVLPRDAWEAVLAHCAYDWF